MPGLCEQRFVTEASMYDLQKHSPCGTPLLVFRSTAPLAEAMRAELVPLLFIDRQATLRPKVQWDVEQHRSKQC